MIVMLRAVLYVCVRIGMPLPLWICKIEMARARQRERERRERTPYEHVGVLRVGKSNSVGTVSNFFTSLWRIGYRYLPYTHSKRQHVMGVKEL
jgi:hypothetical protein